MKKVLASTFHTRDNSLTLIRLALAIVVLLSHAWPLGGYGEDLRLGGSSLGGYAVAGFFALSGYLIAASGTRYQLSRFLWHRFLRIFPAYWVCLVLVAVVAVPLVTVLGYGSGSAGVPAAGAIGYVVKNASLLQIQTTIPGTLAGAPLGISAWNGAVWTLPFEFACYLGIATLAALRLLRWPVVAVLAVLSVGLWAVYTFAPGSVPGALSGYYPTSLLLTGSLFLGGTLVYLVRSRIPASWQAGVLAGIVAVWAIGFGQVPPVVAGMFTCMFLLWLSTRLRQPRILDRYDLSYGTYIYAFPVAQVLTALGANRWGAGWYVSATLASVLPLAYLSWVLVERPALSRKGLALSLWRRTNVNEAATEVIDIRSSG